MKKEMLINVLQPEECRIAIVEDGVLEELYVERTSHESYVGNIYKGRIVNIEPSIQAAFVDFGVGRNGFLHVSDVEPAYYRHLEQRPEGGRRDRGGRDRHRRPRRPAEDDFEDLEPEPDDLEGIDAAEAGPETAAGVETAETSERPEGESQATEETEPRGRRRGEPGKGRRRSRGRSRRPVEEETPEARPAPAAKEAAPPTAGAEPESPPVEAAREGGGANEPPPLPGILAEIKAPPSEGAPPASEEPKAPPQKPQLMDSAEHRTEEGDAPAERLEPRPSFDDKEDIFAPPPAAPAAIAEDTGTHSEPESPHAEEQEGPAVHEEDLEEAGHAEELAEERLPEFDEEDEPDRRSRRRSRDDRRGRRPGGRRGPSGRPGAGRPKPLIQDIFRRGQEVLVQVIKEGIGTKGPTLSTYISIAGRYLVLMPGLNRIGVSRKIADDEQRRRLREILSELQPPRGLGFIIRTAGLDKNKKELQRDLAYLSRLWQVVVRRIRKLKAPAEIYQESDMITRTIRDTFTSEIDTIWVDEPTAFEHAQEFLQIVMPRYANRIKCYTDAEPMFHKYGIEEEIARIQQRHVPLPNGGSIVIEQTEALVAIDVNSGNFRADNNAEETAYQMNLLAAKEIARQLRLRDLGGVIVNDFIDMRDEKHRRGVERAMREAVKRDRARTKILKISSFGLIEMTRQRIRPSLKRSVYQDCPHCMGTGQVKTCESMSIDVMRMLQLAAHREHVQRIQVRVAEEVAHYLLNRKRKEITRLEESGEIQVHVTGLQGAAPELLDFVCYDRNNNEVKFLPFEEHRPRRR
jgi:ribonuclease E